MIGNGGEWGRCCLLPDGLSPKGAEVTYPFAALIVRPVGNYSVLRLGRCKGHDTIPSYFVLKMDCMTVSNQCHTVDSLGHSLPFLPFSPTP